MRINNNIMAMNTHRQFAINNGNVAKSTEKLSSGYRINRAGDDAAGLAISEKMRAQIRGLNMASKNSEDAISLVQTAEGALTETHSILQRMRELSTQSASDTNQAGVDRDALNSEFQELSKEIDDIANKTQFNNMKLLDGTFHSASDSAVAASSGTGFVAANIAITGGPTADATFSISMDDFTFAADGTIGLSAAGEDKGFTYAAGTLTHTDSGTTVAFDATNVLTAVTTAATGAAVGTKEAAAKAAFKTAVFGAGSSGTVNNVIAKNAIADQSMTIQTGANQGDTLKVGIGAMDAGALKVNSLNISTRTGASRAITGVNTAINTVSTQRAKLGALQNRLQHKINNLDTSSENLQAAESRIRDLDMAKEMTTYTKNNILVQAATAMLAQANSAPQGVLQLLR